MTHTCTCGHEAESMDAFVDHVADTHDALSVAVETLLSDADPGGATR